jgi:hypothetical protein
MDFAELLKYKNALAELNFGSLPVPLYRDTPLGQKTHELMLSANGKAVRSFVEKMRPTCVQFPRGIFILSDGAVTTCCRDSLGLNAIGSVYHDSLEQLWATSISSVVRGDLYDMPACRNCIGTPAASLTSSPEDIARWQESTAGYPDYLQIEIMGACNYACCLSPEIRDYRPVKPDLDAIFSSIAPLIPHLKELNLFNYGEPLLHDGLAKFVGDCRGASSGVAINIATNGMLLNEQFADSFIEHQVSRLIVSVHGGPGTEGMLKYSKVGANYDTVLANLRRLVELKASSGSLLPRISFKAILFNWNDDQETMERFRSDARSLGLRADLAADADNYYWVLNAANPDISSARFTPGSAELQKLQDASEAS